MELKLSSCGTLTASQVKSIFDEVQRIRLARARKLIAQSHEQQRTEAMETPFHKFFALKILPRIDTDTVLFNLSQNVPQANKLDMIKLPTRPLLIRYHDDIPTNIYPRGWYGWLQAAVFILFSLCGYWATHIWPASLGLQKHFTTAIEASKFGNDVFLRSTYTSIHSVDWLLTHLVIAFLPGVAAWDQGHEMLQRYLLASVFTVLAVWSVEACRKRNALALISL